MTTSTPFSAEFAPGRGLLLPEPLPSLLLGTTFSDAREILTQAAQAIRAPGPSHMLGNGFGITLGNARLSVTCVDYLNDGIERVGEITVTTGIPARLNGFDLLTDPAEDVLWLLAELDVPVNRLGAIQWLLPRELITLLLLQPEGPFSHASLWAPAYFTQRDRWRF